MQWIIERMHGMSEPADFSLAASGRLLLAAITTGMLLSAGCITPSPFRDPFVGESPATTASTDGIREANVEERIPEPNGVPKAVILDDGTVTHRPLYFEDPREYAGSEDGQIAWTNEDFIYLFTGPARFLGNLFTAPAEMVFYPPWDVMASDGMAHRKVLWWWVDSECYDPDQLRAPAVVVETETQATEQ